MLNKLCLFGFLLTSVLQAAEIPDYIERIIPNLVPDPRWETIKKYRNNLTTFIETGTCEGTGICMAMNAGFSNFYSIEIVESRFSKAKQNFRKFSNVHLFLGDSALILGKVLSQVKERSFFWLDAHNSEQYLQTPKDKPSLQKCPLIEELRTIALHPIKNHTILIDDIRICGTDQFDNVHISELIAEIKKINPSYLISLEEGYEEADVLLAYIP